MEKKLILMTTNCLVPPKDSYKDKVYTTGVVGFEGVKYIPERRGGRPKWPKNWPKPLK